MLCMLKDNLSESMCAFTVVVEGFMRDMVWKQKGGKDKSLLANRVEQGGGVNETKGEHRRIYTGGIRQN